jgi:hypothetical protein
VCFLSGEVSIRDDMDRRGSAARFIEIVAHEPLLPADELRKWYGAATRDYGWFGRDLMKWALKYYVADDKDGRVLLHLYDRFRGRVSQWCHDHPRLVDSLALLQVGYYLADSLLRGRLGRQKPRQHTEICTEAAQFAQDIYGLLHKTTRTETLLTAIADVTGIGVWIDRGFIPTRELDSLQEELDIRKRSEFANLLKQHGIASGIESRKTQADDQRISQRCYILTAEAKKAFGQRVVDHSPTTDWTTSIPWRKAS